MLASQEIRDNVIAIITDALQNPELYGDRFFVQLVSASDRGYMPVTLVHSMIAQLQDIPVSYIEYCADKEPDRLQLSIDRTKIRIARHDESELNNAHETDPYGHVAEDHQVTKPATATVVHKKSKFFRPYTPSYVSPSVAAPIFYDDGKFYNDFEELNKHVREDRPRMEVPPYAKLEIDALGDPRARESLNVCWNCGSEDHSYAACSEPRDDEMIKYYREKMKKKSSGPVNTGRFFVELALKNEVAELYPGRLSLKLQDALGMNSRHSDPPYYLKMRQHGYPPGFWGTPKEKGK
ncbi:hypothetical protein BJV82DRAFT_109965 [Fennellomyces sp. T-0311]|nr:hypothetical protein BJV82DRAFT_109965 [Fennellomyces sp. T-0311]